jgi:hypothetical protein
MTATPKDLINAAVTTAVLDDAIGKKWYSSKTVWTNVVAAGVLLLQLRYGFIIDPTYQSLALSCINLVLRKITKDTITF